METAGIVAEYNPFHNGHAWQLKELKKQLGDVSVVACMSGAFVQRGEAAIASPLVRAEMAIRGGIDLVLELPVAYSLRSADYFAAGAVQTLAATGLVTHLVCGIENPVTEDIFPEQNSTSGPGQEPQSKTDEGSRQEPQPGSKQGLKLNQAQEQGPDTNFPKPRLPFAPPLPETAKWSLTAEAESRVHLFTQAGFSYAAAWERRLKPGKTVPRSGFPVPIISWRWPIKKQFCSTAKKCSFTFCPDREAVINKKF